MSDIWEDHFNLEWYNDDTAAGDEDRDGYTNLQESRGMTNPISSANSQRPDFYAPYDPLIQSDGKTTTYHFRWYDKPGVRYQIEGRTWFGGWQSIVGIMGNGGSPRSYSTGRHYNSYRLRVVSPSDYDSDGLGNDEEALFGSNPYSADADNDGLEDADEFRYGGDPNDPDTDNDGLGDYEEAMIWGSSLTDPDDPSNLSEIDRDNDGMSDVWEWYWGVNSGPSADPDGDGYSNLQESLGRTDPFDSGFDERPDFFPGYDPSVHADGKEIHLTFKWYDKMNVFYRVEGKTSFGTWAVLGSAEGDGMGITTRTHVDTRSFSHYRLVVVPIDVDGDGLDGNEEFLFGTDPYVADVDNDGLNDGQEFIFGGDPESRDGDNDGLSDYDEVFVWGTDPAIPDVPHQIFHP